METEPLKEQLSGPGFYYLDFDGWRVSLGRRIFEFHFSQAYQHAPQLSGGLRMRIWKLLAEIVVQPGDAPSGCTKGFMNVTTWATSSHEAREKLSRYLESFGWHLIGTEEEGPIDDDLHYGEEVAGMIERTRSNTDAIVLGTFHTYKET